MRGGSSFALAEFVAPSSSEITIDEYLRDRLMPVEGEIPRLHGIEIYGDSIPAGTVGGDLFEYINFQHRYDIESRIASAEGTSRDLLKPGLPDVTHCDCAHDYVNWLRLRPEYRPELEHAHREARGLESAYIAENLKGLYETAGVLLVDAQGHGVISAKIASTVHDTFHAFMLCELERYGTTTPELFENLNLRLARSATARHALDRNDQPLREIATMLYGEMRPSGQFRFVNFGHPPPLLFSARTRAFERIDVERMVQFMPLGLEVPEDHPDRRRYASMGLRQKLADCSDVAELTLINPGDILFLYTDGVYDGSDEEERSELEGLIRTHASLSAKRICSAVLEYAARKDQRLRARDAEDLVDDKTVAIIKRCE